MISRPSQNLAQLQALLDEASLVKAYLPNVESLRKTVDAAKIWTANVDKLLVCVSSVYILFCICINVEFHFYVNSVCGVHRLAENVLLIYYTIRCTLARFSGNNTVGNFYLNIEWLLIDSMCKICVNLFSFEVATVSSLRQCVRELREPSSFITNSAREAAAVGLVCNSC